MSEQFTFFWSGPFSQWHRGHFVIDGIFYNTAEQWMMAEKARLFQDNKTLQKILKETSPKKQKALGREVKNFDARIWNQNAKSIVYKGNYAKFTQDDYLLKQLLATLGTTLVEASPYDRIWGIGLTEDDPRAMRRDQWQGTNWLGEVLTQLREDLVKSAL